MTLIVILIVIAVPVVVFGAVKLVRFIDDKYGSDEFDEDMFEMGPPSTMQQEPDVQAGRWEVASSRFSASSELDAKAMKHLGDSFSVDEARNKSVVRISAFGRDSIDSLMSEEGWTMGHHTKRFFR